MLFGENTLHLNKEEKSPEELQDAIAGGLDDVLGGDPQEPMAKPREEEEEENEQASGEEAEEGRGDGEGEEDEAGEAGEGESGEGEAAAGEEQSPDYSVPEGLNERSTERFNKLVEDNKAQRELVGRQTETINGMRQMVIDSGLSNEEYIGAIDFASTVKRDPAKGIKMMQGYIQHIAKTTGIEVEGMEIDVLDDFPDLKEKVEDMEITKAAALELAQARRQMKAAEQRQTHEQDERVKAAEYMTAQDAAVKQLTTYLQDISTKDIDWEAKAPLVLEAAQFARNGLHPSKWVAHIKAEYDKINRIAGSVRGKKPRHDAPLHGGNAPRGGNKEPQTIAEALDQLL